MTTTHTGIGVTRLPLDHLEHLTDNHGLFEHTLEGMVRLDHGYCLDDAARALEFTVREWASSPSEQISRLTETYLTFVERAIVAHGGAHNRMDASGLWTDRPGGGDWWGRAVRALGTAAAVTPDHDIRERAAVAFRRASYWDTNDLRAQLYAAVGAVEVLTLQVPGLVYESRQLLAGQWVDIGADASLAWPWPEPRLRYANGIIPEALIAAGHINSQPELVDRGLYFLDFLLHVQTSRGHLSLVGQGGWGSGEPRPQFDQQPIEAVTLATACARAFAVTNRARYRDGVEMAWQWFLGDNDSHTPMVDLETGAGYDGLTATGRNLNQGAESTLAALTTFQAARECGLAPEPS